MRGTGRSTIAPRILNSTGTSAWSAPYAAAVAKNMTIQLKATSNKVVRLGLEADVLQLSSSGKTHAEISDAINKKLMGSGEQISTSSITRYLRWVRKTRSEETRIIVQDHIKGTVPADLEALDEVEAKLLEEFRDESNDFKFRMTIGMNVVRVIETKLRFSGVLETPSEQEDDIRRQTIQDIADEAGLDLDLTSLGEAIERAA